MTITYKEIIRFENCSKHTAHKILSNIKDMYPTKRKKPTVYHMADFYGLDVDELKTILRH